MQAACEGRPSRFLLWKAVAESQFVPVERDTLSDLLAHLLPLIANNVAPSEGLTEFSLCSQKDTHARPG